MTDNNDNYFDKLIAICKQRLFLENGTFSRIDHGDGVAIVDKIAQSNGVQPI